MHLPRLTSANLDWLVGLMICTGLSGCNAGGAGGSILLNRGEMSERLTASEVAVQRTEARIRVDQYDLGLRNAAASAPGQTADESARQKASAAALTREIKELRKKLSGYRREQKSLRSRLGQ